MTAGANRSVTHTVTISDRKIVYELTRKKVKNINLRIKPDGSVHVSASNAVTIAVIERFMKKKSDFILSAIDKYSERGVKCKIQFAGRSYRYSGENARCMCLRQHEIPLLIRTET